VTVTVIDYGAGNLVSVELALQRLGVNSRRAESAQDITAAEAVLLPGVGHFAALMRGLDARGFRGPIRAAIGSGVPFLGICLGLQALFCTSDEARDVSGLGVFPGAIRALPPTVKLPHIGWNRVEKRHESRILGGIGTDTFFYFAHSYAAIDTNDEPFTAAISKHGGSFVSALEKENVWAVQFHPEKSGAAGERVLRNFAEFAAA
jgi:imidazole glycerol phosphate synthase glutamine amidotransferase subunit